MILDPVVDLPSLGAHLGRWQIPKCFIRRLIVKFPPPLPDWKLTGNAGELGHTARQFTTQDYENCFWENCLGVVGRLNLV